MRCVRFGGSFLGLALIAAVPASAMAHSPGEHRADSGKPIPAKIQRLLGARAHRAGGGLYEVAIPHGADLLTHGPDTRAEMAAGDRVVGAGTAGSVGFAAGDVERPPVCSTDYYQRVLYAHPPGADRLASVKASLQAAMRRTNAVLNQDSLDSGGPTADYKLLCDSAGGIRVDGFTTSASSFSGVVADARAAGYNAASADYTIFLDVSDSSYCGVGSYVDDQRLSSSNANNSGGHYAIAYKGCWYDETPMHENGHNEGAVQHDAPFSSGDAHCYDELDVMCYDDAGPLIPLSGLLSRCSDRNHFDCGHDSYFDTAPQAGDFLASHWNIGSPLNRFIQLGSAGDGGGGTVTPPPSTPSYPTISLVNRLPMSAHSLAVGGWRYFKLRIPSHSRYLTFSLNGPACDVAACPAQLDLYVVRGGKPTLTHARCSSTGSGSDERCRIFRPRSGVWYAGVRTAGGLAASGLFMITGKHRA
ncbi:MAG: hypothetical protein QOJ38_2049 [Solirubrobacterales bacterium]|jgi:hypothetical protein|nr:hypothetical protein [Solirubrobacterales bacterium]